MWNKERKEIVERIDNPIAVDTNEPVIDQADDHANLVSLGKITPFEAGSTDKMPARMPASDHDFSSDDSEEYKDGVSDKESIVSEDPEAGHVYDSDISPQTSKHETFEDDGNLRNYSRRLKSHVSKIREQVFL
jgi:hypothetical protein